MTTYFNKKGRAEFQVTRRNFNEMADRSMKAIEVSKGAREVFGVKGKVRWTVDRHQTKNAAIKFQR